MTPKSLVQLADSKTGRLLYTKSMTKFITQLELWLKSSQPKTIAGLLVVSQEKSFAVLFLVLMALPALPLPTGGLSHVFEAITVLVALELVAGRTTVWLPQRWLQLPLGKNLEERTLPYLIRKIRWLEKYSRPRLASLMTGRHYLRLVGLIVAALSIGAFLSPPFSGLDTLPSMGVVAIALALILEDSALFIVGCLIGALGVFISVSLGSAAVGLLKGLF